MESKCLALIRIEADPAQRRSEERRMHGDDGAKATPGTTDGYDVLMFGPRQTLELFIWHRHGLAGHEEILWVIESAKG
jgi:hypothetical protein